jgi:hypothetical protein
MTTKLSPVRLCEAGCGQYVKVRGRVKLCDNCCPKCECGNRRPSNRPRCRNCASRRAELEQQLTGRGDSRPIIWVKNSRGVFVRQR